jgi:hypothetical protein
MRELIEALAKAKLEFKPVVNDKVNAYAKFRYASLGAMLDSTTEALSKNGLVLYFTLDNEAVTGVLCHTSGESIQTSVGIGKIEDANKASDSSLKMQPMQKLASVITGLKRYILMALLGLAGEDPDDDENTIDTKTQEWILSYIEDLGIDQATAATVLYKSTGVKTRKAIPPEKLTSYLIALKNEKNKPKAGTAKPESSPETVGQNPQNG